MTWVKVSVESVVDMTFRKHLGVSVQVNKEER